MKRDSVKVEPFEPFVAGAWAVAQIVFYLLVFGVALILLSTSHDWGRDLGRGLFWYFYHAWFSVLALVANLTLGLPRVASSVPLRLAVWAVVMAALVGYAWPSWSELPLAVPFAHACALVAIWAREEAGWYVSRRMNETPSA